MIDDDRRLGRERAREPAVREETRCRKQPQEAAERGGRFLAVGQHTNAAVLGPRLRHESRRDLEPIGAVRVEVDDRHCCEG